MPWTGLEVSTRAYAKIIDEVNKLPLSTFQRPEAAEPEGEPTDAAHARPRSRPRSRPKVDGARTTGAGGSSVLAYWMTAIYGPVTFRDGAGKVARRCSGIDG